MKIQLRNQTEKHKIRTLYISFAAIVLMFHYFIITGTNDDAWFAQILDKYTLWEYLADRYAGWTSRIPIEIAVVYFTRMNAWIWKIMNAAVTVLLVYECNVIWGKKENVLYIILFMSLLFLFPVSMLSSAGWISTSINYFWPITAGIFTLIPLHKMAVGEKVCRYEYVLGLLMCIFGCCQEQVVAVMFVVYLLYGAYFLYYQRGQSPYWWCLLGISLAWLIFVLTCPGNGNRSVLEIETWFPEFANITMGEKVLIGYLTTCSYYITCEEYNIVFLLLTFGIAGNVFFAGHKRLQKCIAWYPFIVTFFWGLCGRVIIRLGFTSRIYWLGLIQNQRIDAAGVYSRGHIIIECLVFGSVLVATIYSLYLVWGKRTETFIAIMILSAALCSRMVVGLSPVIYASGSRTATLGHIGFMIVVFMCMQRNLQSMGLKRFFMYYIPIYIPSLLRFLL